MPTLDWIGKDKVINHHKDVPYKVFERKYSFDESGMHKENIHSNNMIIHGDNLEALKSLLPQYEGKMPGIKNRCTVCGWNYKCGRLCGGCCAGRCSASGVDENFLSKLSGGLQAEKYISACMDDQ